MHAPDQSITTTTAGPSNLNFLETKYIELNFFKEKKITTCFEFEILKRGPKKKKTQKGIHKTGIGDVGSRRKGGLEGESVSSGLLSLFFPSSFSPSYDVLRACVNEFFF